MNLNEFIIVFQEEVEDQCSNLESEKEQTFVEKFCEYLSENGLTSNVELSFGQKSGIGVKVNAYSFDEEEGRLFLYVADFDSLKYGKSISKTNVEKAIKRVVKYYTHGKKGMKNHMEETSSDFPLAELIHAQHGKGIKEVEFFLLTNSQYKANEHIIFPTIEGVNSRYEIYDIERLFQLVNENQGLELVEVDFEKDLQSTVQMLKVPTEDTTPFDCYIGYISTDILARAYELWGQRLIERNVRSFLQARGKVNKGIRDTLKQQSEMFIAYNNGISTVAENADFDKVTNGVELYNIKKLAGWQIVNGGQTTASLYQGLKDNTDLKNVYIQMKLTVVKSSEDMGDITSKISEYANTQNRISLSDLKANHPSLIKLETISRTTWVPSNDGRKSEEKYYFERARGQYLVDVNRQITATKKKHFQKENPKSKVLDKTKVAKYYMAWERVPHILSKGAEANFEEFMKQIEINKLEVTAQVFKEIVSKKIIFDQCDSIVKSLGYPGYKANIVYYSIAMLSHLLSTQINLLEIWNKQSISDDLKKILHALAIETWCHITNPPINGTNITQWCKKKECWESYVAKSDQIVRKIKEEKIQM
ncbi:AIPR family protein [Bacillus pseudomycoides]|uniref:AIPR family protein n=1 Tax=Bacillus pseudomycoides TaxID=64104 RepID=UPI0004ED9AC2|nr:AIPR family protein [Bacillus pseudomycoides]AIK40655.1 AIPR family protein [Bacillus pseudomycoides]AJI16039.1 AIPR family protein [Bacillus pseudomycoides]